MSRGGSGNGNFLRTSDRFDVSYLWVDVCTFEDTLSGLSGFSLLKQGASMSSNASPTVRGWRPCPDEGDPCLRRNNLSVNRLNHWLLTLLSGSTVNDARRLLRVLLFVSSPAAYGAHASLDSDVRCSSNNLGLCLEACGGEVDQDTPDFSSSVLRPGIRSSTLGSVKFLF